jgi:hypothetical protein
MATYYIPVSEIGLVEFLSSGYIGIANSKVEYADIHTECWPATAVLKEIEAGFSDFLCEIEVESRALTLKAKANGKAVKMFQLKRPTSVGDIKRILFSTQEALEEFVSKYHYMEDLNIADFELVWEPALQPLPSQNRFISSSSVMEMIFLSGKTEETSEEKQQLIAQARELFSYITSFYKYLPVDTRISLEDLNYTNNDGKVYKSIASLLGCNNPSKSLELLLSQYSNLCKSESVDARSDQIEILEQITEKLDLLVDEQGEVNTAKGFIDRVTNVFMGMESHPDLSGDNSEKAFQFGFYVSLILKRLQDMSELKNRFRFSGQVEAIASYFFLLRSKFSQVSAETFNQFGSKKRDWSAVFIDVYKSDKPSALIKFSPKINSLDLNCTFFVNDNALLRYVRGISPIEGQVISTVKRFNVEPARDSETGFLSILKYVSNQPVKVLLEIVNLTENHHVNEVHIHYRSNLSHNILGKVKSRLKLLNMLSRLGVAIGVDESGFLVFSRLQMVDTMDKDELWHHIEQVADTGALVESQEW